MATCPGISTEWTKLLLILDRYRPSDWAVERAERLFNSAMKHTEDREKGGMHYSFAPDGTVLDTARYYWVIVESFAAAALLGIRTGKDEYWESYYSLWACADQYFVDHQHGGRFRTLEEKGKKYSNEKSPPSKTDYHSLAACHEVLEALAHAGR